jgi:hypothetical protein
MIDNFIFSCWLNTDLHSFSRTGNACNSPRRRLCLLAMLEFRLITAQKLHYYLQCFYSLPPQVSNSTAFFCMVRLRLQPWNFDSKSSTMHGDFLHHLKMISSYEIILLKKPKTSCQIHFTFYFTSPQLLHRLSYIKRAPFSN